MRSKGQRPVSRPLLLAAAVAASLAILAGACVPGGAPLPVMGSSKVNASQMAGWFNSKASGGGATVPVEVLAQQFLNEGEAEGVAGDVAFVQAMIETGWLRFSARMPVHHNNFSGIGAVDSGSSSAAFHSAEVGVRAQIQHLRAYADSSANVFTLNRPLVDPRFHLVNKGVAPSWGHFGNGNWATDPGYAFKVHSLYAELQAWAAAHP